MNTEELKRLAEAASPGQWLRDTTKWSKHIVCGAESDHTFIGGPICETRSPVGVPGADPRCEQMREANAAYIAAANPAAILALIQQRDELLRIAGDAATSLETIHIRSFGDDSYLNHPDQMRAYAGSRAGVVRKELKGAGIDQ